MNLALHRQITQTISVLFQRNRRLKKEIEFRICKRMFLERFYYSITGEHLFETENAGNISIENHLEETKQNIADILWSIISSFLKKTNEKEEDADNKEEDADNKEEDILNILYSSLKDIIEKVSNEIDESYKKIREDKFLSIKDFDKRFKKDKYVDISTIIVNYILPKKKDNENINVSSNRGFTQKAKKKIEILLEKIRIKYANNNSKSEISKSLTNPYYVIYLLFEPNNMIVVKQGVLSSIKQKLIEFIYKKNDTNNEGNNDSAKNTSTYNETLDSIMYIIEKIFMRIQKIIREKSAEFYKNLESSVQLKNGETDVDFSGLSPYQIKSLLSGYEIEIRKKDQGENSPSIAVIYPNKFWFSSINHANYELALAQNISSYSGVIFRVSKNKQNVFYIKSLSPFLETETTGTNNDLSDVYVKNSKMSKKINNKEIEFYVEMKKDFHSQVKKIPFIIEVVDKKFNLKSSSESPVISDFMNTMVKAMNNNFDKINKKYEDSSKNHRDSKKKEIELKDIISNTRFSENEEFIAKTIIDELIPNYYLSKHAPLIQIGNRAVFNLNKDKKIIQDKTNEDKDISYLFSDIPAFSDFTNNEETKSIILRQFKIKEREEKKKDNDSESNSIESGMSFDVIVRFEVNNAVVKNIIKKCKMSFFSESDDKNATISIMKKIVPTKEHVIVKKDGNDYIVYCNLKDDISYQQVIENVNKQELEENKN